MTQPNGDFKTITLKKDNPDDLVLRTKMTVEDYGIYAFEDTHGSRKFAIIGDLNAPEFTDIISTENKIKNIAQKTGGNVMWLENKPTPSLKRTRANTKSHSGSNWLGLKRNDHYTVTSTKNTPLFPSWLQLLALLLFLPFIWWREGKE